MSSSATNTTTPASSEHLGFELRYGVDRSRLPRELGVRAVELALDAETQEFMDRAARRRHGRALALLHDLMRPFMSDFDVNGLLGTYPMFLLGTAGFRRLLGARAHGRLLDVGAGNGDVTALAAPLFDEVSATETSAPMARRLEKRGFPCRVVDLATDDVAGGPWDVVSLLNVLDRSPRPRSLLCRARDLVASGGSLLLGTPLPYDAFMYDGGRTRAPRERLDVPGKDWESALTALCTRELRPLGLEVEAFTRAPYLSGGDPSSPLYVLDDAVIVCSLGRPAA